MPPHGGNISDNTIAHPAVTNGHCSGEGDGQGPSQGPGLIPKKVKMGLFLEKGLIWLHKLKTPVVKSKKTWSH